MKLSSSKDGIKRLSWKVKKFWAEKEVSVWHNHQSGARLGAHKAQDVTKRKLLRKSREVQVLRMALEGLLMWMLKPQTQRQRVNKHHHPECHQGVPGVWQVTVKAWRVRMQLDRRERVVDVTFGSQIRLQPLPVVWAEPGPLSFLSLRFSISEMETLILCKS